LRFAEVTASGRSRPSRTIAEIVGTVNTR
jgi:hypothetical protein